MLLCFGCWVCGSVVCAFVCLCCCGLFCGCFICGVLIVLLFIVLCRIGCGLLFVGFVGCGGWC